MTRGLEWDRERNEEKGAVIYRIRGVLGETTDSFAFLDEVREHMKEQPKHLILNLAGVNMMTSSGIGIVASCFTEAKADGRTLSLCEANRIVHRALDLTGFLPDMIAHYDTEEAALAAN